MTNISDDEKTIVNFNNPATASSLASQQSINQSLSIPKPGRGRLKDAAASEKWPGVSVAVFNQPAADKPHNPAIPLPGRHENTDSPLIAVAQTLLNEIVALQKGKQQEDFQHYRNQINHELCSFERLCLQQEISEEHVIYSRYVLCTAIDEMVNKSPWAIKGEWSKNSLLAQYHGETDGGEKFYELLEHLIIHPAKHIQVLELMFLIMNLGFEGKYHLQSRGYIELEKLKDNVFQTIRLQRGEPEPSLSLHWQGVSDHRNPLMRYVPAWVFLAVTGLVIAGMYLGFGHLANQAGDHTVERIEQLTTSFPDMPDRLTISEKSAMREKLTSARGIKP